MEGVRIKKKKVETGKCRRGTVAFLFTLLHGDICRYGPWCYSKCYFGVFSFFDVWGFFWFCLFLLVLFFHKLENGQS